MWGDSRTNRDYRTRTNFRIVWLVDKMDIANIRAGVYFRCPVLMGSELGQIVSVNHKDRTVEVRWVVPNSVDAFKMDTILNIVCEFASEPEQKPV